VPNPLTRTLRAYAADARAAFRSAPVEVALGVFLAATLSAQIRHEGFTDEEWMRAAASVALAFPLVLALSVLAARGVIRSASRWAGTVAVLAGCAALGAWGMHEGRDADGWRWVLLASAAVLLLGMTPGIPWRERDRRRSWAFGWRLALRVVGIGLYAVALFAVLAGAAAAVISLFELRKPEHLYTDLAGIVFFAFAPWIFVGGIERFSAPPPDGVPEGVSRLGRWLYAPVLVIYLAVLYAYALKVVATGELPRNLVSPLVIAAGLIGLLGAVFLEPVHDHAEHRGVSLLVRAVPALLLPLVPLALWALGTRLGQHGWTEFRYVRTALVAAIGVVALLGTIRLVRRRRPMQGTVPAVFAAVLLASAVGPWSASAVSRRDQASRLRAELRRANVDPRRLPADTVRVDSVAYERIGSIARYLVSAHGVGALRDVVPAVPDTTRGVWELPHQLGLRRGCRPGGEADGYLVWGEGVPGVLGGTLLPMEVPETAPGTEAMLSARLWAGLAEDRLRVRGEGWTAEADLRPLVRRMGGSADACGAEWTRNAGYPLRPADALVPLRDAMGAVRGQLLLTRVRVAPAEGRATVHEQPGLHVRHVNGYLVVP
jgi:cytochrome bd-type quinol oxidase subunit 2